MCRCGTSRLLVAAPGAPAKGAAKSTSVRPHASPRRAAAPTWGCTSYAALVRRCAAASCWGGPSCAASVCLWVCAAMHSPRKAFWQSPCHSLIVRAAFASHHRLQVAGRTLRRPYPQTELPSVCLPSLANKLRRVRPSLLRRCLLLGWPKMHCVGVCLPRRPYFWHRLLSEPSSVRLPKLRRVGAHRPFAARDIPLRACRWFGSVVRLLLLCGGVERNPGPGNPSRGLVAQITSAVVAALRDSPSPQYRGRPSRLPPRQRQSRPAS